eukprot:8758005-Prorocentrum_lima.AAC.1
MAVALHRAVLEDRPHLELEARLGFVRTALQEQLEERSGEQTNQRLPNVRSRGKRYWRNLALHAANMQWEDQPSAQ